MYKKSVNFVLSKISQGIIITLVVLTILFTLNKDEIFGQLCLYEAMPAYDIGSNLKTVFAFDESSVARGGEVAEALGAQEVNFEGAAVEDSAENSAPVFAVEEPVDNSLIGLAQEEDLLAEENVLPVFEVTNLEETDMSGENTNVIGTNDVVFQPETEYTDLYNHFSDEKFTIDDITALRDVNILKNRFYVVDKRTDVTAEQFNVDKFLKADLSIDVNGKGPKVLIFHTHSNEKYSDSVGENSGVLAVGEELAQTLTNKYGIETLHNTDSFDTLDGQSHIMGAYERMEPVITKILKDNPTIQVAIDIHRDGVNENVRLVENINGKQTAQIMFFNGLSKLYKDGVLEDVKSLPNKNIATNLALSFKMQLTASAMYPNFTRKIYLNAYRYSLHMLPKSMLIEIGAQTNTEQEARNAVEPLAQTLATVILKSN